MKHDIIKTDNYLLVVSDEEIKEGYWVIDNNGYLAKVITELTWHFINSKKTIAHLPLNNSPILEGVDLLDVNIFINYLKEFGYWNSFCIFVENIYNEKKH